MTQAQQLSNSDRVRAAVRERYAGAARAALADAAPSVTCCGDGCCSGATASAPADPISSHLYGDIEGAPTGALAASLGCGNPTALVDLHPGEIVLDLGSGGGLDVLLSARRIGPDGHAYGVDMTEEMLLLAERHRAEAGVTNATFMRGTIEDIPLPDGSVDVVISNCVINLAPDKDAVLREAHRVLRPGGRFAVSDIVLLRDVPPALAGVVALWTGCVSGALRDRDYVTKLRGAGFADPFVQITRLFERDELQDMASALDHDGLPAGFTATQLVAALDGSFASAFIRATKPSA